MATNKIVVEVSFDEFFKLRELQGDYYNLVKSLEGFLKCVDNENHSYSRQFRECENEIVDLLESITHNGIGNLTLHRISSYSEKE